VEEYYRKNGLLMNFNVLGGIPETWPRLLSELNLDAKIQSEKMESQAA
jgi:adenylate kinase